MSDHSKPRRWRLAGISLRYCAMAQDGPVLDEQGPLVPVREDCVTEADVEAVAETLFLTIASGAEDWAIAPETVRQMWRSEARLVLARIFEGGEQS